MDKRDINKMTDALDTSIRNLSTMQKQVDSIIKHGMNNGSAEERAKFKAVKIESDNLIKLANEGNADVVNLKLNEMLKKWQ